MPQLDPAVFLPQIFWLFILFGVIYLFVARTAAPKIAEVLERRQVQITADLEDAEKQQTQAEEARISYERALEEARARAAATVAGKRDEIKTGVEAEYNKLSEKLGADSAAAEAKISAAREKAFDDIRAMSADVSREIIRKVSGLDLDDKTVAKAVDGKFDAVKERANG